MSYRDAPVRQRVGPGSMGGNPAQQAAAAVLAAAGLEAAMTGLHETDTTYAMQRKMHGSERHSADLTVHDPADQTGYARVVKVEAKGGNDRVSVKLADLIWLAYNAATTDTRFVLALYFQEHGEVWFATPQAIAHLLRDPRVESDVHDLNDRHPKPCVWITRDLLASWRTVGTVQAELRDAYNAEAAKRRQEKLAAA